MAKKKKRLKKGRIVLTTFFLFIIIIGITALVKNILNDKTKDLMPKLNNIDEVNELVEKYSLNPNITYEYSKSIEENNVISQSIKEGSAINKNTNLDIVISKGYNLKEKKNNVLKHAELIAIEKASKKIGDWRLNNCILYTTLFPCPMCASAIQQSRIKKVIYLNDNPNFETKNISLKILNNKKMNHQVKLEQIKNKTSLLNVFFKKMRTNSNVSRETLEKIYTNE